MPKSQALIRNVFIRGLLAVTSAGLLAGCFFAPPDGDHRGCYRCGEYHSHYHRRDRGDEGDDD